MIGKIETKVGVKGSGEGGILTSLKKVVSSDNIGLIIAMAIMVGIFSMLSPNYFTSRNFVNILIAASLTGLIAVGESMLLIGGMMDLSPGSVAAFSGVVSAILLQNGTGAPLTIGAVIVIGAMIGCLNAFFVTKLKISPFIVTLAAQSILRGFAYIICGGQAVLVTDSTFLKLGVGKFLGITFPVWFLILTIIVFGIILNRTRFGRNIYIVGGNPTAARLAGINNTKMVYMLFIIMGILASIGGAILAARMNSGQPSACVNLEFDGITAAILGGVAMSGGHGSMFGTVLGLLILTGFNNGLILLNVQSFWQLVAKGGLLLLALSFDYLRMKKRAK